MKKTTEEEEGHGTVQVREGWQCKMCVKMTNWPS